MKVHVKQMPGRVFDRRHKRLQGDLDQLVDLWQGLQREDHMEMATCDVCLKKKLCMVTRPDPEAPVSMALCDDCNGKAGD